MWQRYLEDRGGGRLGFASVAADAQGRHAALPWVGATAASFPTFVDPANRLGQAFGYQAIPVGIFVRAGGAVEHVRVPFSVERSDDRAALEEFVAGRVASPPAGGSLDGSAPAIDGFAEGAAALAAGDRESALRCWREALRDDPANFLIRKQIWAVEHPDKFYPAIDRGWQARALARARELPA